MEKGNHENMIELLTCDKKWPVCLFDFTYKNKVPDYFVFRVDKSTYELRENYFYPEMSSNYDCNSTNSK